MCPWYEWDVVHVHSKKLFTLGMNGMFVHVHSKKLCTLGMNGMFVHVHIKSCVPLV